MKAKLAEATQEAPSVEVVEPEVVQRYYAKFDEAFFTFSEKGTTLSYYKGGKSHVVQG